MNRTFAISQIPYRRALPWADGFRPARLSAQPCRLLRLRFDRLPSNRLTMHQICSPPYWASGEPV
jgi:hypothetical protein